MDPDDVRQLLSGISHLRDRAMILLLLRTGMRIGELLETKLRDVNLKERTITIWEGVKNRRGRVVYVSDDARDALRRWLKQREAKSAYLFYGYSQGRLSYSGARLIFRRNLSKVGLADKGYTLHCLRHTFASRLVMRGVDLRTVQELGGWKSLNMVQRYAHLSQEHKRQAIELLAENSPQVFPSPAKQSEEQIAVTARKQKSAPIAQLDRASAF